jgi:hypothetical protein
LLFSYSPNFSKKNLDLPKTFIFLNIFKRRKDKRYSQFFKYFKKNVQKKGWSIVVHYTF